MFVASTCTPVQVQVRTPPVSAKSPVAEEQIWPSLFVPEQPELLSEEVRVLQLEVGAVSVPVSRSVDPSLKATLLMSLSVAVVVLMVKVTSHTLPTQDVVKM